MGLLYDDPSLKQAMRLPISLQLHQLKSEKLDFEVLYTPLVFLSIADLYLTIQLEVVVVEMKMCEIVLKIPIQKGSAWRNYELQNYENMAIAPHSQVEKTLCFGNMKTISVLDHILHMWNYSIGIGLPTAQTSSDTLKIYWDCHTKVPLCTTSHYVPSDSTASVYLLETPVLPQLDAIVQSISQVVVIHFERWLFTRLF